MKGLYWFILSTKRSPHQNRVRRSSSQVLRCGWLWCSFQCRSPCQPSCLPPPYRTHVVLGCSFSLSSHRPPRNQLSPFPPASYPHLARLRTRLGFPPRPPPSRTRPTRSHGVGASGHGPHPRGRPRRRRRGRLRRPPQWPPRRDPRRAPCASRLLAARRSHNLTVARDPASWYGERAINTVGFLMIRAVWACRRYWTRGTKGKAVVKGNPTSKKRLPRRFV
jgi:hypothetical protein